MSIISLPKPGSTLKFENDFYSHPMRYIVFADFESMFLKSDNEPSTNNSSLHRKAQHKVIAYTYYIVTQDNQPYKDAVRYVGEDAAPHFYNRLVSDTMTIEEEYHRYPQVPQLSQEERENYEASTYCCICNPEFAPEDEICNGKKGKIIHHCM